MAPHSLHEIVPTAEALLALEPEELGPILVQLFATHQQNGSVLVSTYRSRIYPEFGPPQSLPGYPEAKRGAVEQAIAEAFSWLEAQTLFIHTRGQSQEHRTLSRRAQRALNNDRDFSAFKHAELLPRGLLPEALVEVVYPLFLRGSYDTAVFEAFRAVEIAVRDGSNRLGANFPDDLVSTKLMSAAFHIGNGPLRDANVPDAERQAELSLFLGAMGHARNPVGHRVVGMTAEEAARLVVFASYLLAIVAKRSAR